MSDDTAQSLELTTKAGAPPLVSRAAHKGLLGLRKLLLIVVVAVCVACGSPTVNGYKIQPGADLRGADLRGADLTGADLTGADLTSANLTEANLTEANLTDANFTDANLKGANVWGATLPNGSLVPRLTTAVTVIPQNQSPSYDDGDDYGGNYENDYGDDYGYDYEPCYGDCNDMDNDGRTWDDYDADGDGRYETR